MYVVAGATGNTGSVVASSLLESGQPVRVIVRHKAKGDPWVARGAESAVASLDESESLARALEGADGLYYLIPPDVRANDYLARARNLIDTLATVLGQQPIKHVVFLSSIG